MNKAFATYYELGRAAVAFSALEAGGFKPVFANYNHANMAAMHIIALGGITIMLPENKIADAADWIQFLKTQPLEDYDPITPRKFGMWKRATVFGFCGGILLPILFLPPLIFAGLWGLGSIINVLLGESPAWILASGFWPALLMHAKYIAGPKFLKGTD